MQKQTITKLFILNTIFTNNRLIIRNGICFFLFTGIFIFQSLFPVFSQNRLSQLVQNSKPSVFSIITYDNKNNPMISIIREV